MRGNCLPETSAVLQILNSTWEYLVVCSIEHQDVLWNIAVFAERAQLSVEIPSYHQAVQVNSSPVLRRLKRF